MVDIGIGIEIGIEIGREEGKHKQGAYETKNYR